AAACHKSEVSNESKKAGEKTSEEIVITEQTTDSCGIPLKKDLMDVGGVKDWGDIIISNDADSITVMVSSTDTGMYITKITLVYGSQDHLNDYLTNPIMWTPCEGPARFDRQKTYAEQTTVSDTLRIPNSALGNDSCVLMSVQVALKGTTGTLGCA